MPKRTFYTEEGLQPGGTGHAWPEEDASFRPWHRQLNVSEVEGAVKTATKITWMQGLTQQKAASNVQLGEGKTLEHLRELI